MNRCKVCNEGEDQHHEFEPRDVPEGCVCDPIAWSDEIDPICPAYVGDGRQGCLTCYHDTDCHEGRG